MVTASNHREKTEDHEYNSEPEDRITPEGLVSFVVKSHQTIYRLLQMLLTDTLASFLLSCSFKKLELAVSCYLP